MAGVVGPRAPGAIVPLVANAVSDSSGNISFTFEQTQSGVVLQGTVCIPKALITSHWTATVSGVLVGAFDGYNAWGEIQVPADQALMLTGTGLTPTTAYQAVWMAAQYPEGAAPVPPIPYGGITNIANTVNVITPPVPPYQLVTSTNLPMTGVAQQLTNQKLSIGLILLADPSNANPIYISNHGSVATGSAYIKANQGIVIPIANASGIDVLGTAGDVLSYWGA